MGLNPADVQRVQAGSRGFRFFGTQVLGWNFLLTPPHRSAPSEFADFHSCDGGIIRFGVGAAMLADVPMGESPIGGACSVATVVIPGGEKGDRLDESLGVKASDGWDKHPVGSAKGASNSTGRSE